ncbi:MAG: hypothetical protein Q8L21_03360 [Candidatus Komeilibacteria bacterium]|nr:hypothetical protein [Candidatus Komeilibacteria bacterium]
MAARLPHEVDIIREQRLTFFQNDQAMQRLFNGDFESYNLALDRPELMIERLEEAVRQVEQGLARQTQAGISLPDWWQDEFWGEEFSDLETELDDWPNDLLYQKANKWAQHLSEVASRVYEQADKKDPDVYRVLVNIFLVPAKIIYAAVLGDETELADDDVYNTIESEINLHDYTLCLTFLQRVRESLARLINKGFAPVAEWRAGVRAADELALDIQSRMIELTKRLRYGGTK